MLVHLIDAHALSGLELEFDPSREPGFRGSQIPGEYVKPRTLNHHRDTRLKKSDNESNVIERLAFSGRFSVESVFPMYLINAMLDGARILKLISDFIGS